MMKKMLITFILLIVVFLTPIGVVAQQATIKTNSTIFNIPKPENEDWYSISSGNKYFGVRDGGVYYSVEGVEHYILNPSDTIPTPPVHFIKKEGQWEFEGYYPDGAMDQFRNCVIVDDKGTIAIANHGNEIQEPWPYGDIFLVKTIGDSLKWLKVSTEKSYYHSLAVGDINNDGLFDIIGSGWHTKDDWTEHLHPYIQNPDGSFREDRDILSDEVFHNRGGIGAIAIADLFGDERVEIVMESPYIDNGYDKPRFTVIILGYNQATGKYEVIYETSDSGSFETEPGGATSLQIADFNNDKLLDLAFSMEGGVQIFENDGTNNYIPKDLFIFTPDIMTKGEPIVADVDNDGWRDIVLQPYGWGNLDKINQYQNSFGMYGTGFKLNYYIWKNNNGKFEFSYSKSNLKADNMFVGAFKATMVDGTLKMAGFGHVQEWWNHFDDINDTPPILHEIEFHFCETSPIDLDITQYCDSTELRVPNFAKGEKYIWNYGDVTDTTDSPGYTFFDETSVKVIRLDSFGCGTTSETQEINIANGPGIPEINVEDNTLVTVEGMAIYEWYKNDTLISNTTTNRLESPTSGNYKVIVTNNIGCSNESNSINYTPVSVEEMMLSNKLRVYPNPVNDVLIVETSDKLPFELKLFDSRGAILFDKVINQKISEIDVSTLPKGVYFAQFAKNSKMIGTTKIIK